MTLRIWFFYGKKNSKIFLVCPISIFLKWLSMHLAVAHYPKLHFHLVNLNNFMWKRNCIGGRVIDFSSKSQPNRSEVKLDVRLLFILTRSYIAKNLRLKWYRFSKISLKKTVKKFAQKNLSKILSKVSVQKTVLIICQKICPKIYQKIFQKHMSRNLSKNSFTNISKFFRKISQKIRSESVKPKIPRKVVK